jgi:hypothetical protein
MGARARFRYSLGEERGYALLHPLSPELIHAAQSLAQILKL